MLQMEFLIAPNNDDKVFSGNISLRDGLTQSKNVSSVLVENTIGLKTGIAYGEKVGLIYNAKFKIFHCSFSPWTI